MMKRYSTFLLFCMATVIFVAAIRGQGFPILSNAYGVFTSLLNGLVPASGGGTTNFLRADGSWSVPSGGGTGGGITVYSGSALTITAGTYYFPIGGGALPSSTEANVDVEASSAATITNFYVQMSAAIGMGNMGVFTWRKAGSSQSLTCTLSGTGASGSTCNDTTHSFTVAQGDLIDVQLVTTGTIVAMPGIVMSVQFGTTGSNGTVNPGMMGQLAYYAANGSAVSGESANITINGQMCAVAASCVLPPVLPNSNTGAPYTTPTITGWTLRGSNGTVDDFFQGPITLSTVSSTNTLYSAGYTQTISVPYTIIAHFRYVGGSTGTTAACGLMLTDGTKFESLEIVTANVQWVFRVDTVTSFGNGTDNVVYSGSGASALVGPQFAVKIVNDSTHRTFYAWTAETWTQAYQENSGTFLTETSAGIRSTTLAPSATAGSSCVLDYWNP